MKTTSAIILILFLSACTSDSNESGTTSSNSSTTTSTDTSKNSSNQTSSKTAVTAPMIGERIDGPANIRDAINGQLLFTLYDHTLVNCTALKNNWYTVGLLMDIGKGEAGIKEVKKGRKIMMDGKEVGELKADMEVYTGSNDKEAWAELIGYTHKDNIKPESIIENALAAYLSKIEGDRTSGKYQNFIRQFDLEKSDQFEGYTLYYTYENWIDDPSPMWRIALVFQKDRLVSILHARPLKAGNTTKHKIGRGFGCLTYNDIENSKEIVDMFKQFVNSVD